MSLQGRVALITGASRGIGKATARVLAAQGTTVAINSRSSSAQEVAAALRGEGFNTKAYVADISNKREVNAMVERVERELGPLWLLVNNAGLLNAALTAELSEEAWGAALLIESAIQLKRQPLPFLSARRRRLDPS